MNSPCEYNIESSGFISQRLFYLLNKCTTRDPPCGISREIYNIVMFDVVVSILKFAEDEFHKLSEGYGIYVLLQYLM